MRISEWSSDVCSSDLFGGGEATIVAARQVRRIVSVESDPARLRPVQEKVAREAVEFIPVHIDIGPVGEGGYPAGEGRIRDWPRYHAQVWRGLGGSPDAVALAGRFRRSDERRVGKKWGRQCSTG